MTIPSLQAWREKGEFLTVGKLPNFCPNPRVVAHLFLVLHGFPTASYDYARVSRLYYAEQYQLIFFDFLGYGFSDKPKNHAYSLFEQADITEAIAAHFSLENPILLTHDMGNSVTLEVMKRGNLQFSHLIMLNGSVLLDHYQPVITQTLLLNPIIGSIITKLRLIRRPIFARQFGKVFAEQPSSEEINAFWDLIRHNDGMTNYHLLIRYLNERKIHEHTWLDTLAADKTPLTVIWGQADPVAVPKIAEAILRKTA